MSKNKNGKSTRAYAKEAKAYAKEDLRTLSNTVVKIAANTNVQVSLLFVVCVVSLAIVLFFSPFPSSKRIKVGSLAKRDILASRDVKVEDVKATAYQKTEILKKVYPIYNYDPSWVESAQERVHKAFTFMRDYFEDILSLSTGLEERSGESPGISGRRDRLNLLLREEGKRRKAFEKMLGIKLKEEDYLLLKKERFSPIIEKKLVQFLRICKNHWIVASREVLPGKEKEGLIIRNIRTEKETIVHDPDLIFDLDDIRGLFVSRSEDMLKGLPPRQREVILSMALQMVRPNVVFDREATQRRIRKAMEEIKPVVQEIRKGDVIVHKGERVTVEQLQKIKAIEREMTGVWKIFVFIGFLLLTLFTIYIPYDFSVKNIRKVRFKTRDLLFLSLLLVAFPLALKFYYFISYAFRAIFPFMDAHVLLFLFPLAAAGMFVRIALNSEVAFVFSVVLSIFFALVVDNSPSFGMIVLFVNLIGAELVSRCERRSRVLWAGLASGVLGGVLFASSRMIQGVFLSYDTGWGVLFAVLGGFFSGVLVLGVTPLIEALFGYTTDVKLLELANLEHPLLKEMVLKAPGTYHHSIMVASLAEAAARDIGAHPILVRVGAYYHDIGKIKKPLYFIENQQGGENKHDKLSPSMSSLILISHVKEGVELAKAYHLGSEIIDIIQQHHGTSLIKYFYNKAKEGAPENSEIDEKIFRYPGPKPQTREAGLIMLADAVEATAKSLETPTPARINTIIKETFNRIFLDGQLDECELTLKNLHQIADRFRMVLMAIFHHRIDYPSGEKQEQAKTEEGKSWPTYGWRANKAP